jgi:hypothetical protein
VSVYTKRRILAKELVRALRENFVVVANPDHPFLLRAADVIVGGDSMLLIVFIPSAAETRKPDELKARLILNRLALPAQAKTVLLFDSWQRQTAEIFANDFDKVIPWEDRELAPSVLAQPGGRVVPPEIKLLADRQFAMAATVTSLMRRIDREPERRSIFRNRARKSIERFEEIDIARFSGGRFDAVNALEMINGRINDQAQLDQGVPYFSRVTPSIAVVGDWPTYPHDPDKILRVSAFAGWSIMTQDQGDRIPQAAQFIRKRLQ